jgi:regulator of protease activity HflC (stomatin/prohibitin superfamily)
VSEDVIRPRLPLKLSSLWTILGRIGKRLLKSKIAWIVFGALFLGWCAPSSCSTYVPPNMIAVRQVYYGSSAGIKNEKLGPGLHFVAAGIERLHLFPADLQLVNFTDSPSEVSRAQRSSQSIKIQTSDGYNVQLDVSVIYRLEDPYKIFTEAGPGRAFEDRLVLPRVDRVLRKTLGELNSEEFYQGPSRIQKSELAQTMLATELKEYGIVVAGVLVRNYVYDQRYQQIIESRKIKDQTVFLRQAEAKAAVEQRKRDTAVAEGKANADVELERGKAEVQKLHAQADLYRRKKGAEGKLLVDLAEAKGTGLENTALQGAGAENMVGLKMADVLKGLRAVVLTSDGANGLNPLDLQSLLKKFEVR